ncbi:hypothetical protein TUZN_0673 [Thermoproteus uzoniensis 768-20]|uniref:Uncharacterized protein n=2 Tax=Thermoproteus TaxID=2270 RepID=F2L4I7_THEU7|nr:hypothetical protein TUZN_0673 [Thermoproteus uzoniensis 768-20]
MMLKRKKKELDEDEEIEKLLRDDATADDAAEGNDEDRYLKIKIEVEGLRELTQALEELVEAIKSREK